MEIPRINFKNDGERVRNDSIHRERFPILNCAYAFVIFPKTKFWRFGLRFSKTENIKFDLTESNRHLHSEFKDLHLSVGSSLSVGQWENSNRLELTQYHFGVPNLWPNDRCEKYQELSPVQFGINYDDDKKILNVKYSSSACGEFEANLELESYRFFSVFAWADSIEYELDCTIEQMYGGPVSFDSDFNMDFDTKMDTGKDKPLVKGLVATDDTGWFEDAIGTLKTKKYVLLWWDKLPSGSNSPDKTLDALRHTIDVQSYFELYYTKEGNAHYRAVIRDFALYEDYSPKDWRQKYKGILLENDFNDYVDYRDNSKTKKARIVFVADVLEKTEPEFSLDRFTFLSGFSRPVHNNLQPYIGLNLENLTKKKLNINLPKIASLISDDDKGEDQLEIEKDVNAFAKIMASKDFKPPLAIALFGKWGAGKSFFMNKLKAQVELLAAKNTNSTYISGISQIHFNAWSYLDANLWASIVTKIFEGLNEYISGDDEAKKYKAKIEKSLTHKLTLTKDEQTNLLLQKRTINHKLIALKNRKNSLDQTLRLKINDIKEKKLADIISEVDAKFKVSEKLDKAIRENASLIPVKEKIKEIVPESYWKDPNLAYNEAKSNYVFFKEFIKGENVFKNILWLTFILLIILIVPELTKRASEYFWNKNFTFPQIALPFLSLLIPISNRIKNTYNRIQPIISAFWKIKTDYEKEIENLLFEHQQNEKVLKLEIESSNLEIEAVENQILQVNKVIGEIDYKINNTLATEALYSFIEKRSDTEDYKKYLGIVSSIRKDFEILNRLFVEHNKESEAFRKNFDKPLERIILYIDDLDRCPEERVVEVLEAVNLLMAFPLFVVVVGVDPRWVKNSLIKKHGLQFSGNIDGTNSEKIEASNYLEKIFQVPFHLKEATDTNVKTMLKNLSATVVLPETVSLQVGDAVNVSDSLEINIHTETDTGVKTKTLIIGDETEEKNVIPTKESKTEPERLILLKEEIELIQEFSKIIGTNPRAIKRFINVYHIVRAHEGLTIDSDNQNKEYLIIMFLLALHVGPYQKVTKLMQEHFHYGMPEINLITHIDEFRGGIVQVEGLGVKLPKEAEDSYSALYQMIHDCKHGRTLFELTAKDYGEHFEFIRRFTFAEII